MTSGSTSTASKSPRASHRAGSGCRAAPGRRLVRPNPLDVALWTFRRSERDVVRLYEAMSPLMQAAAGGIMLNFGLWDADHADPASAQENLCMRFAGMAELGSAGVAVDAGSGLYGPARLWAGMFPGLRLCCINTSRLQASSARPAGAGGINASASALPLAAGSADRVLALESAQHFRPLGAFLSEARRVLAEGGLLAMAVPVTAGAPRGLGILRLTWSSEHYSLGHVRQSVREAGFEVEGEELVGGSVYAPLADYYMANRGDLRGRVLARYPRLVESVLARSLRRMRQASESGTIEYVLLKCRPVAGPAKPA